MKYTPATKVWNIHPVRWDLAQTNEMTEVIYEILLRWLPFANEQFAEWDGRPNCGHFFGGNYWYVSDSASTSYVFATLASLGNYDESLTGIPRLELKQRAIKALRYMGFTHDTGPADCVRVEGILPYTSGKKWGGRGDNYFMASQNGRSIAYIAMVARLLWDDLDDETKILMQNVISSFADEWSVQEPWNGVYYDTQCEENAWTSAGIAAGVALFPSHPHHRQWLNGFNRWAMNSVTVPKDRIADPTGLIDATKGNLVKTITFHPDFTAENHAFVHPSYVCAGTNLRGLHAVLALMGGQDVLPAALHNNVALYENTIKKWAQFDGLAIPIQGQDWWYNRQHERQLTHAILNVIHGNNDAARFERTALESVRKIQLSNTRGCLLEERGEECVINRQHAQFAKDLEHGSATDLTSSYLLHLFGGMGAEPSDQGEMLERLSGVHVFPHGSTIIHRTPTSFTSFSWRNNVMGLTLPKDGLWNVTPLYISYTGAMKFKNSASLGRLSNESLIRDVDKQNIRVYEDGFGATVTISRGEGQLCQDVAFVALPTGSSVYMERIRANQDCELVEAGTGMIGVRNENYHAMPELAAGSRTLYYHGGSDKFDGFYGREPNLIKGYESLEYVNLDHKVGYIMFGQTKTSYLNKHEYPKWKGVEDILTLNDMGSFKLVAGQQLAPFVVVTNPNQTAQETEAAQQTTHILQTGSDDMLIVETDKRLVYSNFATSSFEGRATRKLGENETTIQLYAGQNRLANDKLDWCSATRLEAFTAGYVQASLEVKIESTTGLLVEFFVTQHEMVIFNRDDSPVTLRLRHDDHTFVDVSIGPLSSKHIELYPLANHVNM